MLPLKYRSYGRRSGPDLDVSWRSARELFFGAWEKSRAGPQLAGLESTALEAIMLHPEYHALLSDRERNIERDYPPEAGAINPFLHLNLNLSIIKNFWAHITRLMSPF